MIIKLLKCGICTDWYSPRAHKHCPYCGSFPLKLSAGARKYYALSNMRLIEVVRGIDNPLRASVLNTLITK